MRKIGIGAHVSIKGGFAAALKRAETEGLDIIQIFSSSPRSRMRRVITNQEVKDFIKALKKSRIREVYIHTPYYINPASPDSRVWHFSKTYLLREIEIMDRIGARYFVMHMGSHKGSGIKAGLQKVTRMLKEVIKETPYSKVKLCLENTAGQTNDVGADLKNIGKLLRTFKNEPRLGLIIDTCHLFAAGYELRTKPEITKTFSLINKEIGWNKIPMLHINDSKFGVGGNRDRHAHLGQGQIGETGFKALLASSYLKGKDLIVETEPKGRAGDIVWLKKFLINT